MKGLMKIVATTSMLAMLGACTTMKEIEVRETKAHPSWYEDCKQIGSEGFLFWKTDYAYSCGMGESKFEQASESQAYAFAVKGYAEISNDQTNILCVITPTNGNSLVAGTTYVYDIEIARESTPYNYIYTLLTGTVTVSAQVSQPTLSIATLKPNHISNLTQTGSTSTSVSLSWTAPAADASYGEATTYEGYILEVTDNILIIGAALQAGPVKTVETTEITFEWLDSAETVALSPETAYMVAIIASNLGGDASIATWTDLPTAIASGAVLAPVLTLGESS